MSKHTQNLLGVALVAVSTVALGAGPLPHSASPEPSASSATEAAGMVPARVDRKEEKTFSRFEVSGQKHRPYSPALSTKLGNLHPNWLSLYLRDYQE